MDKQLKFEIIFRAPLGEIYADVIHLAFVRSPLVKNASFVMLKINLPPVVIQQMYNDLSNNIYQDTNIEIYNINEQNNKPVTLIFSKLFKILHISTSEPLSFTKQTYQCELVL